MSTQPVSPQVFCPSCGRANRPDAAKCWWCGTALQGSAAQTTLPYTPIPAPNQPAQGTQGTQPTQRVPQPQGGQAPQGPLPPDQAGAAGAAGLAGSSLASRYSPQAPTERFDAYKQYADASGYGEPAQQAAPPPAGPPYYSAEPQQTYAQQPQYIPQGSQAAGARPVPVTRRGGLVPLLLVLLLFVLVGGGLIYALQGPFNKIVAPGGPTATPQPGISNPTSTALKPIATATPEGGTPSPTEETATPQITETAVPVVVATDTPIIVPTVTPVLPTDTPEPPPPPTDTPAPPPVEATATPAPPPPGGEYSASVSADPRGPKTPNGTVRINGTLLRGGQPVEGAAMNIVVHYEGRDEHIDGATTGPDGSTRQVFKIGKPSAGIEVVVDVAFLVGGQQVAGGQTSFTPR